MRKAVFYKILKIELLVIIVLLLAILVVSVLNDRKRREIRQSQRRGLQTARRGSPWRGDLALTRVRVFRDVPERIP